MLRAGSKFHERPVVPITLFLAMSTFYTRAAALAEALEAYVREVAETNPEGLSTLIYIRTQLLEHIHETEKCIEEPVKELRQLRLAREGAHLALS